MKTNTIDTIAEKILAGGRIGREEAEVLWREAPLSLLGRLASEMKRRKSGDAVYYNRNFHIEPTNICVFNCRFCSYRRGAGDPDAWNHSLAEIEQLVEARRNSGVTEVHIVGGVHPDHDIHFYAEMIRTVKRLLPDVAVKAYTAIELAYMIDKAGMSYEEGLTLLRDAGLQAIPGGGAEIFDEELRRQICPEKGDAQVWLSLHRTAHRLGIRSNATMLYGHVETIPQRIDHLDRLRTLQDETGGFDAFIPLKFRRSGNRLGEAGHVAALPRQFPPHQGLLGDVWQADGRDGTGLRRRRHGRHDRRFDEDLFDGGGGAETAPDGGGNEGDGCLGRAAGRRARHLLP